MPTLLEQVEQLISELSEEDRVTLPGRMAESALPKPPVSKAEAAKA